MLVAELLTVPLTEDIVRPLMGTPVVGVPVGEPFWRHQSVIKYAKVETLMVCSSLPRNLVE
jgi:hypothetical protein